MKIGIDIRSLAAGRKSGVEEYTVQFLETLFRKCKNDKFVLFLNIYSNKKIDLDWTGKYDNVTIKQTRIPNKLLNLSLWYLQWPKLDKLIGGVDVFFMPNINFCSVSEDTQLIVTIHDLSFEHFAKTFSYKRRLWHFFVNARLLMKKADNIIAVSHSTKEDVVATFGIHPNKVTVIHSAIQSVYKQIDRNKLSLVMTQRKYKLPYKFIFSLSTIEPRKNIEGLIRAYEALRRRYNDSYKNIPLIIAGTPGWNDKEIYKLIKTSPVRRDIRMLGFVDEEDKVSLLNLATVFVYPSFFEGFGFPPLEAMACGTPTISSNTSSFPEVVGDGALMIDPDRPEEIMQALHGVLSEKKLAQHLSERGKRRVKNFSWKKAVEKFDVILNKYRN